MAHINDFFIMSNAVSGVSEHDYQRADSLIKTCDAISRTAYQSIYMIDYFKKGFLYVSENPLFLCGHTPEEVKKLGYLFYIEHVPLNEQNMLAEINKAGFNFFEHTPIDERSSYTISYNFHLVIGMKKILINHKLTPSLLTENGRIWLAVCVVSLSSRNSPGHIEIHKSNTTKHWQYSLEKHAWIEQETTTLSEKEKDILYLSAQGYTMNEIAEKLHMAVDTVKFNKRKLFEKLEVKNITEALSFAINHRLL